ncbi:unnamed protein product, partial [Closterium sp. NIES-54]
RAGRHGVEVHPRAGAGVRGGPEGGAQGLSGHPQSRPLLRARAPGLSNSDAAQRGGQPGAGDGGGGGGEGGAGGQATGGHQPQDAAGAAARAAGGERVQGCRVGRYGCRGAWLGVI